MIHRPHAFTLITNRRIETGLSPNMKKRMVLEFLLSMIYEHRLITTDSKSIY